MHLVADTYFNLIGEFLTLTLLHLSHFVNTGLHDVFSLFGTEVSLGLSFFLLDVSFFAHHLNQDKFRKMSARCKHLH